MKCLAACGLIGGLLGIAWLVGGAGPDNATADSDATADSNPPVAGDDFFQSGDHICFLGNTLAERMQHDGWLEAMIQSRYPDRELVFRNLGFSGDQLGERLRSQSFGSPDEWLRKNEADVVFAFFGFNESFAGEAGLDSFKRQLESFIDHTLGQQYNGTSAPRLVIFSPIAHEDLHNPDLPDGSENNVRIALYTQAMAEVAAAKDVLFVDLFAPSNSIYEASDADLTINGIHLNSLGNRQIASAIDESLFGAQAAPTNEADIEKLREAVVDKNYLYFNRYRTTDGYNVFGGRSRKVYENVSNFEVMQREMLILDEMTANRDCRIWAIAQGGDLVVDDSNTTPPLPVPTNIPGPGPNGEHLFLTGEEAIERMTLAEGMRVNLFASEEQFPELANPVQMAWDAKGRLWVAVWPSYPHWDPNQELNDKLIILEDTDGDGKADECTVFADHLTNPTGFEFYNGGVMLAQAPDLMFLKDTDGDDHVDVRTRVLNGIGSADSHHTISSFVLSPGGAIFFQEGTFHRTQTETPYGLVRNQNGCVWRFEPRTFRFERYVPFDFPNPHGHCFNGWGQNFVTDGTTARMFHGTMFSGFLEYPGKHPEPPMVYNRRMRPCPGTEILSSRHFPEEFQQDLLVGNVIGLQGIMHYHIEDSGGSLAGTEREVLVQSTDRNFRPSDIEMGPDGAIYFTDWHNQIIGHLQHHIRDPNRDVIHGRVYRITAIDRPLLEPKPIAGESIATLVSMLAEPDDRVRYRVRIELSGRATEEVLAAAGRWVDSLDTNDPLHAHHLTEALWLHQSHNVVDEELLHHVLQSPHPKARVAATRVLRYWRNRVTDPLVLLQNQINDENPQVRVEAVVALSEFRSAEAAVVALDVLNHSMDRYLTYVLQETMKTLDPYWKKALQENQPLAITSPKALEYMYSRVSNTELLNLPRSASVYPIFLSRPGLLQQYREEALAELAKANGTSEIGELLKAIDQLDQSTGESIDFVLNDLATILTSQSAEQLRSVHARLLQFALEGRRPFTRQVGYVTLITADGGEGAIDRMWELASESPTALRDLVDAVPLIRGAEIRETMYARVEPLMHAPANGEESSATIARFVRIELPGRQRILTLAEVEIMSEGQNIARAGTATQSSVGFGGVASRALDGNKSGVHAEDGQTHTHQSTDNPWWEVDLGSEVPIQSIVIWNRDEQNGRYVDRLAGFTVKLLDTSRSEVFVQADNPAPAQNVTLTVDEDLPGSLRRAAINAVTYISGHGSDTFSTLAQFVIEADQRDAAISALHRIPKSQWPTDEIRPLADAIVEYVEKIPAEHRTTDAAMNALQLGNELVSLLPRDQAAEIREALGDIAVQIIPLRTYPHRMMYDRQAIAVEAGKPVEIRFENTDIMQHNLAIIMPGSLEEVGMAADQMQNDPNAFAQAYIPRIPQVLHATGLLQSRQSENLRFVAPTEPGEYEFVCTFPGHWRNMRGKMYVVSDVEAFKRENLALLEPIDLPEPRDFVKEWTYEDLVESLDGLHQGRNYEQGRSLFTAVSCAQCHRMGEEGGLIGPNLSESEIVHQKPPADMLREMIEPSNNLNENYRTSTIFTVKGLTISGIIIRQDDEQIEVLRNPLDSCEPIIIPRDEIEDDGIAFSPLSMMPTGLLNTMTQDEILDLMAYIRAKGNPSDPVFTGGE